MISSRAIDGPEYLPAGIFFSQISCVTTGSLFAISVFSYRFSVRGCLCRRSVVGSVGGRSQPNFREAEPAWYPNPSKPNEPGNADSPSNESPESS